MGIMLLIIYCKGANSIGIWINGGHVLPNKLLVIKQYGNNYTYIILIIANIEWPTILEFLLSVIDSDILYRWHPTLDLE